MRGDNGRWEGTAEDDGGGNVGGDDSDEGSEGGDDKGGAEDDCGAKWGETTATKEVCGATAATAKIARGRRRILSHCLN